MWIFCVGDRIKIKGEENIPKNGSYLICANHSSFLDIPSIYAIFNDYVVFAGKKEFEKWPLFRIFYTSKMNIAVDRENNKGAMLGFKRMMQTIDDGHPLVIFPEGTISKTAPKLTEFKTGAVTLAIQKKVPILPITFTTSWKRLQRKGLWKGKASPGIIEVIIHPLINTDHLNKKDKETLQQTLKDTINGPLQEKYNV